MITTISKIIESGNISDIIFLVLAGISFLGVCCIALAFVWCSWYQCNHIDEAINDFYDPKKW